MGMRDGPPGAVPPLDPPPLPLLPTWADNPLTCLVRRAQPSHIAKLPAEILLHIFHLAQADHDACFPSYSSPSIYPFFRRRLSPVVALSHVSRTWRVLALADTGLWRTLHLDGEIDEGRAEAKALFWADRATADNANESSGVTSLVLTRVQDWSTDEFTYLCDALDLMELVRLRGARISWLGGGVAADENRQLQSFFRFLVASATTLASITLHTPSHLRILFSLPRLGHTFSALEALDIRSCKTSIPSSDAYLVPTFLPHFAGEEDWAPLAHLRRLVLVGPVWRLRFRDGTVVSPVLGWADVPALEYAHLSATSPPTHWDLLSHGTGTLRHLILQDFHSGHPHLPDPDVATVLPRLHTLKLIGSAPLTARLLDLAVGQHPPDARPHTHTPLLTLPHLHTLALCGAQLSPAHLGLVARAWAPALRHLDLRGTAPASPAGAALTLPAHLSAELRVLVLPRGGWAAPAQVVELLERGGAPALQVLRWSGAAASEHEGESSGDGWTEWRRWVLGDRGVRLVEGDEADLEEYE
ncbi:hypothetical protein JCM3770_002535 [Rhodotorula araucariae]